MNGFSIDVMPGQSAPVVDIQNATTRNPPDWLFDALGGQRSDSGVRVNAVTALRHDPLWQGVNVLAGDLGQLPMEVWTTSEDEKRHADDHPVDHLLNERPNSWQLPCMFKEMMVARALLWGNAVCWIRRTGNRAAELWPLPPHLTHREEVSHGDYVIHTVLGVGGEEMALELEPSETFHIRGLATDGFWGISLVEIAKNVLGHGLALQRHGNTVFRNGAKPSGVLQHPGKLTPEARQNLREEWEALHGGSSNAGRVAILWEDMKFHAMSMSNEDAQWLDAVKLDREQVAGILGLPPYKLGAMENSAVRANIEEQAREYVTQSLRRWGCKFEEEAARKLFLPREDGGRRFKVKVNYDALTRGNSQSQMEYAAAGVTARLLTRNEGREYLRLNPVEGGDVFENPAIDTNRDRRDDDGAEPEQAGPPEDQVENLLRQQVSALLKAEAARVQQKAKTSKGFLDWANAFYDDYHTLAAGLLELVCQVTGKHWREAATAHAQSCRKEVVAMAGANWGDDIGDGAVVVAAFIKGRRDEFVRAIMEAN